VSKDLSEFQYVRAKRRLPKTVVAFALGDLTWRTNVNLTYTEDEWDLARSHAQLIYDRSKGLYGKRAQSSDNADRLMRHIVVGKLAEICIQREAVKRGYDMTPPDLKIYSEDQLRYDPDLKLGGMRLHVKTNINDHYLGWVATRGDPIVHAPDPNDYFVLCRWSRATSQIIIQYVLPRSQAVFAPMARKELRRHKLCILPPELKEVYMRLHYPTMDYIEGRSIYELNVGIETRDIGESRILSVESYVDENDREVFRLWYFVPPKVDASKNLNQTILDATR
jgi:hypothetical protein